MSLYIVLRKVLSKNGKKTRIVKILKDNIFFQLFISIKVNGYSQVFIKV
jgi:hypothetical protein